MMDDIMNAVNETEKTSANDIYNIASGSVDNLHSVLINSEKAELAILTAVEIRNKLLDSYNEIMRISL
jgi:flagellar hook-basal body complex protein FliE